MTSQKISVQDAVWNRFQKPIIYSVIICAILFVGYLFPLTKTVQTERLVDTAATAFTNVAPDGLENIDFEESIPVELLSVNNGIGLKATLSGDAFGQYDTNVTLVAVSNPRISGAGWGPIGRTIVTFWDSVTGNPSEKQLVPNFTTFYIEPGSFTIDGQPAIEFAIPGGQRAVEGASQTGIGQAVTGGLNRLGFDTSNASRDTFTANVMRNYENILISWFTNIVRNEVNGQSMYIFSDSTTEQLMAASFGGVNFTPGELKLKLYIAPIIALIFFAIYGSLFSGWSLFKRFVLSAKDISGLDISDEHIERGFDLAGKAKRIVDK